MVNSRWERRARHRKDLEPVKDVIFAVVDEASRPLAKSETYNILFYASSLYYDRYGEELSPARFTQNADSVYSVEVDEAFKQMNEEHEEWGDMAWNRDGRVVLHYESTPDSYSVPSGAREAIREAVRVFEELSRSEFTDWVRDCPCFDRNEYGDPLPTELLSKTSEFI